MIIGEHAVVHGYPAIVCAVDQRMTVTAENRSDDLIRIQSAVAPTFEGRADTLPIEGPLRYVATVLRAVRPNSTRGLDLSITSDIDPKLGLGSSAAVLIAVLGSLNAIDDIGLTRKQIHIKALEVVRALQGRGSGADLAASLYGGCLRYQVTGVGESVTANIEPLPALPTLSLRYSGYKTPTGEVLARVAEAQRGQEAIFEALYARMGDVAEHAIEAVRRRDWSALADTMQEYQRCMRKLGVSDETLDRIICEAEGALAAKISGSGLGDCVVALGEEMPEGFAPVTIATQGLVVHGG